MGHAPPPHTGGGAPLKWGRWVVRADLILETGSRFDLLRPLGEGGAGAVFMARDTLTGERVAVKALRREAPDGLARFKQEFRSLTELHHPNLVSLRELFEHEGRWFIVMDLVPGDDLLEYVRPRPDAAAPGSSPSPAFDLQRLLDAFMGIAQGLCALHAAGVLHRDLKPSNVWVTPEGRAVLLDFGLATSTDPEAQSTRSHGMGTAAYMAPEQAQAESVTPAVDWYAFGVCLFEALTGMVPFEGESGLQVILRKQASPPPRARSVQPLVPAVLDELCARLLERDPGVRPGSEEVLHVLRSLCPDREVESAPQSLPPSASLPPEPPFSGRNAELERLHHALRQTRQGALRIVFVEGESGIGKTELVQRFAAAARRQDDAVLVLSGRCYENENVPYKAFDGCIDQLASHMLGLPETECAAMLPRRAALLAQLFPVLRQVEAIAQWPAHSSSSNPTARRLEAFDALAELWGRLAESQPVVLTIDDLHWADGESLRLLRALIEHTKPPSILIVATLRSRKLVSGVVHDALDFALAQPVSERQVLGRLPLVQTRELAAALLGLAASTQVEAIAHEAQGHPLFLQELVHFVRSHERAHEQTLTLDAAVASRIDALPAASRALLDIVAVAGRPYPAKVFADALSDQRLDDNLRPLLMGKLLRRGQHSELTCFHDRIREVTVSLVDTARAREIHEALADALARAPSSDPAERALHWELAGADALACEAYDDASRSALDALAFVRAAELCHRATLLLPANDARHVALLVRRADALACAGQHAEAAALYDEGAHLESGEARLMLRSKVANHLLLSAQINSGLQVARSVLGEVGVHLPLSLARAVGRFIWEQLRFAVSKHLPLRPSARERERLRLALRVIVELRRSIPLVHTPAFLALTAQHLRIATNFGTLASTTHAYAIEGWLRSVRGSMASARPLLERSRRLSEELGQPEIVIGQQLAEGSSRLLYRELAAADACFTRAHELLLADSRARVSDLTFTRFQLATVWYMRGQDAQLARETSTWLAEARERRDAFGTYMLLGPAHGYVRHLMRDDPAEALRELQEARAALPDAPVSSTFAHIGYALGIQMCFAYQGGGAGLRWLQDDRQRVFADATSAVGLLREAHSLCRLIGVATAIEEVDEADRPHWMQLARKHAKRLARSKNPSTQALAQMAHVQVEAYEGNLASARRRIASVRAALGEEDRAMGMRALYLEGIVEGGAAGRGKRQQALDHLAAQGWQDPARAITVGLCLARVLCVDGELQLDRIKPG